MTLLSEAYQRLSPYDPVNIFSSVTQEQLASGYVMVPNAGGSAARLKRLIDAINNFLWLELRLLGVDGHGKIPPFFVELQEQNAFYHPRTLFSGECFKFHNPYIQPAIVAHEYTHGIIENFNPLGNRAEPGAINEAIADIVGVIFNQAHSSQPNNWSVGGLRDLSATHYPDGTIKHRQSLGATQRPSRRNDFGYVHHNSEVLSHAFFLASRTLSHYPGVNQILLKIWFNSVMTLKEGEKTFEGLRDRTIALASQEVSPYKKAVIKAWQQVGF